MPSLQKTSIWKSHGLEIIGFTIGIFVSVFILLFVFDFVPKELESGPSKDVNLTEATSTVANRTLVLPSRIRIPKINVDTSVSNPQSDNVDTLDEYLKKGAVRYPGSGDAEEGNMFLFAHSTGFKVVNNQAYKAFNNLKLLSAGDSIFVEGEDGKTYLYKVAKVTLASDKDVLVRFDKTEHMITLSTCNTFGKKEERYVVEAYFDSAS